MDLKYTLSDTTELMQSDDYKERLKAEYWQLVIRLEKLRRAFAFIASRYRTYYAKHNDFYTRRLTRLGTVKHNNT